MFCKKILPVLSLCAFCFPGLQAADWPLFRGAARDDISTETGLLKTWPEGGPALAWKASGIGGGFSGVSVSEGRVFTMGEDPSSSLLFALDEATGKQLWSAKVGPIGGGSGYPGHRCTPTADGNLVFAFGQFGDLVCVDSATGKEVWRKNLEKDFPGSKVPRFGFSESPLVDGDKLIFTPGGPSGCIAALNKKTGEVLWRSADLPDNAAYSSLVVATIAGVRQYVQFTEASVAGVSAVDGRLLWRADFGRPEGKPCCPISTPVVDGNLVYVSMAYGVGCNLFRVEAADGKFTAERVYANKEMSNHHGGVIKIRDAVYGYSDGKGWVCQDFKTGQIIWAEKAKLGKGSLSCADGLLYLRAEDGKGTLALIEPSPAGWIEKGRFDQPERTDKKSWPHPVVSNGKLYVRDQDSLFAYDIKAK